jgi:hypothetical protein
MDDLNPVPHVLTPAARPRSHLTRWILIGVLVTVIAALIYGAIRALQHVAPAMGPMFAVMSEISKAYPGSKPKATILWSNGNKSFQVTVAATFDPSQERASAQKMADRIAQIVRDHYNLGGYSGITVAIEKRRSAGVVSIRSGQTFQFPVTNTAKPESPPD